MARSLLGKADPTLVQGSFREAAANIPLNRGPIYATQAENVKMFQDTIQKAYNMQFADYINTNDELKTASKEIMSSIQSGTYTDDESVSLYTNAISDLKSRLKQIPKGKKGDLDRAKVRGELSRMKNSATNAEEVLSKIYTMINNDQHNVAGTGEMLPLFNAIAQGNAKREVVNGELVYSIPTQDGEVKLNHNQLAEKLVLKDHKADANFLKLTKSYVDEGKVQGNVFNPQDAAGLYEKLITSKNSYAHLINESHGMKHSFAEAFNGKDDDIAGQTYVTLNTILEDYGVDIDNDGNPDQITEDNASKFIDALTNIHSKNFNFTAAKKIASMYYAENLARPEYERGQGILNAATASKNKNKKDTGTGLRNNGWGAEWVQTQGDGDGGQRVGWNTVDANRKSLLTFEDFGGVHYEYKYEDIGGGKTQWKAYDSGEFVKDLTMKQIAKIEGLLKPADKDWSIFNEKRVRESEENKEANTPSVPMGFTLASLQSDNTSSVKNNLQNTFDADFQENFEVKDVTELVYSPRVKSKIAKKVKNKIRIISKDGVFNKVYDIGPNATQEMAAQINIDFQDYLKPDPLDNR